MLFSTNSEYLQMKQRHSDSKSICFISLRSGLEIQITSQIDNSQQKDYLVPSYNPAFHKLQKIVYLTQYVSLDILQQNTRKEILMMFFDLRSNWKRVSLPFLSPSSLSSRRSRTQRILIITLMILMMTKPANQIQKIRSQTWHFEQSTQSQWGHSGGRISCRFVETYRTISSAPNDLRHFKPINLRMMIHKCFCSAVKQVETGKSKIFAEVW